MVILKSDGLPTWTFACTVDDGVSGITHVVRGDDHISNTPRQILLARAMGFMIPKYAHLPLIFGNDSTPLSKRHGATSLLYYKKEGYLPEGVLNYLALLGWGPKNNKEFFCLSDLVKEFSFKRVNKTNAIFDPKKLDHINSLHVQRLDNKTLVSSGMEFLSLYPEKCRGKDETLDKLIILYKDRIGKFSDLFEQARYFFDEDIVFDSGAVKKYLQQEGVKANLEKVAEVLVDKETFSSVPKLEETIRKCAKSLGIKAGSLIHPLRVAVTGEERSPGIFDVLCVVGHETVLKRIRYVIRQMCAIW